MTTLLNIDVIIVNISSYTCTCRYRETMAIKKERHTVMLD